MGLSEQGAADSVHGSIAKSAPSYARCANCGTRKDAHVGADHDICPGANGLRFHRLEIAAASHWRLRGLQLDVIGEVAAFDEVHDVVEVKYPTGRHDRLSFVDFVRRFELFQVRE